MKYLAVTVGNNGGVGQNSGFKASVLEAEKWLEGQLSQSKSEKGYVFASTGEMTIAPRQVQHTSYIKTIEEPTEENTHPDLKCEACHPDPFSNGHDDTDEHLRAHLHAGI